MTQTILSHATPESRGIASSAILDFLNAIERDNLELHSFLLLRHDAVVAQGWWKPYAPEHPHMLYSLSKSFTSTAAGLAVSEGKFSLDDTVVSFFPDDLPAEISPNLAAMRVRDMLIMGTGHDTEPSLRNAPEGNWAKAFLAHPVPHKPGTHFLYNSAATYMVSALISKTTGLDLLDYLTPRLFAPLGFINPTWERCPRGIPVGGWGLSIRTEEIARFGLLYLKDGIWNGTRILPEGWVQMATAKQISNGDDKNNDWNQGYGFQFWRCVHNAYRGDGAFGQFCVVMPEKDAVIAITARVDNMGAVLKNIWDHLLPAMRLEPLAENAPSQTALTDRLAALAIPMPEGENHSPLAPQISGKRYRFESNDFGIVEVSLHLNGTSGGVLTLSDANGAHEIPFGFGEWIPGRLGFPTLHFDARPTLTTGAWESQNAVLLKVCFYETPFVPTVTCRFVDGEMTLDIHGSIGFGAKERPLLTGTLVLE